MGKPAKRVFVAQDFIGKLGEGKSILQLKTVRVSLTHE